jgi:hypothetical protein
MQLRNAFGRYDRRDLVRIGLLHQFIAMITIPMVLPFAPR